MKFLVICAFVIATVAKTNAGILGIGLDHGLVAANTAVAPAPAPAAVAPLPAAPAPLATATLTAAALPAHLPAFAALQAAALAAAPTITYGAPLAALTTSVLGSRALLSGHAAPLLLPPLPAPLHGAYFGAGLAGHALPAHL